MKFVRPLAAVALAAITLTSCSDDPFVPTGPYVAPEYHATLQSLNTRFSSVCGAGDNDIYAFGGALLHYDGSTWNTVPPPVDVQWDSVALGFDNGELVLLRDRDVYIFSAATWNQIERVPDYPRAFWASAPDDLYALTYEGMYRYRGTTWEPAPIPKFDEIDYLGEDESGHLIMCGAYGRLDRFNGTDWTSTYLDSTMFFSGVAVTPAGRTFVSSGLSGIYELIGSTMHPILDGGLISGPRLKTDGETLYAAGGGPNGYRVGAYQNGRWNAIAEGNGYPRDFWAGNGQLACVGDAFVWKGTPSGGAPVTVAPSRGEFYDAVAIGDAIYTVGERAYRFGNGNWTNLDKEYITRNPAFGIHGRQPDNLYAVGREMILHYDGTAWSWVNSGLETDLNAVWVEPNGNVVAVGEGPVIVEYDGTSWSKRDIPLESSGFNDVTGVGNTIFAVGGWGVVAIRKQNHWYLMQPTGWTLTAVWGYDEKHVYAASTNDNEILFYDGNRWEPITIEGPSVPRAISIWGTSPSNIFVLDQDGTLARFNGSAWNAEERVFSANMRAVTGTAREVLTVGFYGSALYTK